MPDNRFLRYKPAHFSAFRFWVFRSIQSYDMRGKKPEKSRKNSGNEECFIFAGRDDCRGH
jgi:hypothetical protein